MALRKDEVSLACLSLDIFADGFDVERALFDWGVLGGGGLRLVGEAAARGCISVEAFTKAARNYKPVLSDSKET